MIVYSNDLGIEIIFKQHPAATGSALIDNESTKYTEIELDGNKAFLFKALNKDEYNILLWESEGVVFEITSTIISDELILIGNSLLNLNP